MKYVFGKGFFMMGSKGISPVVAVVLLIAIAVIAAVGVWYWVSAFTGKPPTGGQELIAISIEDCNGTHVRTRNIGAVTVDDAANIYNSTGTLVGFIHYNLTTLSPMGIDFVEIINTSGSLPFSGTFDIVDPDFGSYKFTC